MSTTEHAPSQAPTHGDDERLANANEIAWLQVATLAEQVNDLDKAMDAYKRVLQQNSRNVHALLQLANISRMQECFDDAIEYLNRVKAIDGPSAQVQGAAGHCYLTLSQRASNLPLVLDCLSKCDEAYRDASQQQGPEQNPDLWYAIGLLYERYASLMARGAAQRECLQAAEESLRLVLQVAPQLDKRSEILYRCVASHLTRSANALQKCLDATDECLRRYASSNSLLGSCCSRAHAFMHARFRSRLSQTWPDLQGAEWTRPGP